MAHQDWVFGLAWIDDEHFVSGSRDTSLALWRASEDITVNAVEQSGRSNSIHKTVASVSSALDHSYIRVPSHQFMNAVVRKECKSAQKVRDVVYNRVHNEIACVSLNGYIHIWDMSHERFVQVRRKVDLVEVYSVNSLVPVVINYQFGQLFCRNILRNFPSASKTFASPCTKIMDYMQWGVSLTRHY